MKAILSFVLFVSFFFGNVNLSFAESPMETAEMDEAMRIYNETKLDYSKVKKPIDLYNQVVENLETIDFFVKKNRGENATVMVSYYRFPETFWNEMRRIVKERKQVRMYYFRYIKDEEDGIDDIYLFWKY